MTKIHGFVICFVFLTVAVCGFSAHCSPNMGKLGDLALVAIGAVSGNAMNALGRQLKKKKKKVAGDVK
jgi:hypothetical protein